MMGLSQNTAAYTVLVLPQILLQSETVSNTSVMLRDADPSHQ